MEKRVNNRELGTGKYTFTNGFERLCVCGHSLGVHSAARIRFEGKMLQDCHYGQYESEWNKIDTNCECECFKPKRKVR